MSQVRALMFRVPVAYVAAQVLTGVEVGVVTAMLVLLTDWHLLVALGVVFPFGLPLVTLQMAAVIGWLGRDRG